MADTRNTAGGPGGRRHLGVLWVCVFVAAGMLGLSFAAVPLYRLYCQVTGFGGTPQRADAAPGEVAGTRFTIRFDANVSEDLPWSFRPEQKSLEVAAGEQRLAFYRAVNDSRVNTVGTAVFNVTPELAGRYFNKIACFCFSEQPLAAGKSADLPVSFFVDPAILDDPDLKGLTTITLSYTFYPAERSKLTASAGDVSATRSN